MLLKTIKKMLKKKNLEIILNSKDIRYNKIIVLFEYIKTLIYLYIIIFNNVN